jgi:predicted GNAT family N-acyltransferase
MKKLIYLFVCLFVLGQQKAFAQRDNSDLKDDSTHNVVLDSQLLKIQKLSAERLADSSKKAELEKQVAQLSSTDNLKRLDLLKALNAIKEKDSLRVIQQKHQVDSLRKFVQGFPVVPFRDTLFSIYTRQGSFTAQERADAIAARLKKLSSS